MEGTLDRVGAGPLHHGIGGTGPIGARRAWRAPGPRPQPRPVPTLLADNLHQDALGPATVELTVEDLFHGPKSRVPPVIATTTSRPMTWRLRCASALSSPVSFCLYWDAGAWGARRSSHRRKSSCNPGSSSLMKTEDVMCMALTRTSPSVTPLSRTHASTSGVMLMKATRSGVWNQSSLR